MSMKGELLFNDVLQTAYANRASDVHIEKGQDGLVFRLRINNEMHEHCVQPDDEIVASAFRFIRRRCGFDSGLDGIPQDASFATETPPCDYRANLMPTKFGEKIVIRLLRRDRVFALHKCGLPAAALKDLRNCLDRKQGCVVFSGPVGSGKTTTLYACLNYLNDGKLNIHTLEHPVEYTLKGITQTEITDKLNFAKGLRGLMRQDIDVILVGEIRDVETAEAATHAASTGHMVLTTVHANSAAETFSRLGILGANVDLFRANVSFTSAQRLIEINCPHCIEDETTEESEWAQVFYGDASLHPKISRGCEKCSGTGVSGLRLVFEWICRDHTGNLIQKGNLKEGVLALLREGLVSSCKAAETV